MKVNPEEKAEIIIYNWLRPKVKNIYFNRKNILSAPTFNVKGGKKPDLIIQDRFGFFTAVEVKPKLKTNAILSGGKQLFYNYYLPYEKNETKYYIDKTQIMISNFVFCSENCIKGYIFEKSLGFIKNKEDPKKKFVVDNNMIPSIEEYRTKDFTRELFSIFKQYRKENNSENFLDNLYLSNLGVLILDIEQNKPCYFVVGKGYNARYSQKLRYL